MTRALLIATLLLSSIACGNDNGELPDAGPSDAGPTCADPNFGSIYTQVLNKPTCASLGCHSGNTPAGSLDLSGDTATVYAALVDADSAMGGASYPKRVVANSSTTSFLHAKVADANPPGESGRMPPANMIPQCDIDAIRMWIDNGAAND